MSGLVAVLPIRQDKSEGNWQWSPETLGIVPEYLFFEELELTIKRR